MASFWGSLHKDGNELLAIGVQQPNVKRCANTQNTMAKFQIRKSDANNQFYYQLRATGNSEIILRSEAYVNKAGCENAIESVKVNATNESRYDRLHSAERQYHFNLNAANGEIIGTSETYVSSNNRDEGIALVKAQAPSASTEDLS